MTSIDFLVSKIASKIDDKYYSNQQDITEYVEQAKEMEKQQIMEFVYSAVRNILNEDRQNPFNLEQYYAETYGSKASDETKTKIMKTGTSSLMDSHLVDFTNPNANNIKSGSTTSSQTEISDEDITKLANEHILYNDSKRSWVIEGMKLYREHLKIK